MCVASLALALTGRRPNVRACVGDVGDGGARFWRGTSTLLRATLTITDYVIPPVPPHKAVWMVFLGVSAGSLPKGHPSRGLRLPTTHLIPPGQRILTLEWPRMAQLFRIDGFDEVCCSAMAIKLLHGVLAHETIAACSSDPKP